MVKVMIRKRGIGTLMLALVPVFWPVLVSAQAEVSGLMTESLTHTTELKLVMVAFGLLLLLLVLALVTRKLGELVKGVLFGIITFTIVATTLALIVLTVRLNTTSWSKGPIHWHADFEVWACDKELDLIDPKGFSNKVGTQSLHEHNDKRIHFEGVVVDPAEVMLSNFFNVIGGNLADAALVFPTNNELATFSNGDRCPDGKTGEVQVFVYRTNPDKTFAQEKLLLPETYIMSQVSQVPPADCIIIEFNPNKEKTDHICRSYGVAQSIGKLKGD